MKSTLKASTQGLKIVDRARKNRGWTKNAASWCDEAHISQSTLKRFWRQNTILESLFINICQAVRVNWRDVADGEVIPNPRQDWSDEPPDVSDLDDRARELETLEQWIVSDKCRLVALLGMSGIGKTVLAVRSSQQIQDKFDYVVWRSLRHCPPLTELLADLNQFFSAQNPKQDLATVSGSILQLMEYLKAHRCLIVLDGVEALLETGQFAGQYQAGYSDYGRLFMQLGESHHQSCLLLTSSEKLSEIHRLASKKGPVRLLKLSGLATAEAEKILREKGLVKEPEWQTLISIYRGNPLFLKIVASTIVDLFGGQASRFLKQDTLFLGKIDEVLAPQLDRLSDLETKIMYQLAIERHPQNLSGLQAVIGSTVSRSTIIEAVESLEWRSLIETITESSQFTLQPVVKRYIIKLFCQTAAGDL